jgi:Flp pilus assembly protein TadD
MDAKMHFIHGLEMENKRVFQEAANSFYQAIKLNPKFTEAYNHLGIVQAELKLFKKAVKSFRQAIKLNPNHPDVYNNIGLVYQDLEYLDKAEASICYAIKLKPNYPEAFNNLGVILKDANRLDEAEKCFQRAIELKHDYLAPYINWSMELKKMKRLDEAAVYICQAIQLSPNDPNLYNQLGLIFKDLNRLNEAEACVERAIKLKSDNPILYNNLGLIMQDNNRLDQAASCFLQAIRLNPNDSVTYNNLSLLFKKANKLSDAEDCLRRAIQLNPDYSSAYNNLGMILKNLNRLEEAEMYIRKAITLNANFTGAYNNLGVILKDLNCLDEAERYLRRAIALKSDYIEAHFNLGLVLKEANQLGEAENYLCQAIRLKPDYPEAHFALSTLYLIRKQFEDGWKKYEMRQEIFHHYQPPISRWQGEELTGRKILLYYEQGFGDTIQFARYIPKVAELAAKTVVWVQESLQQLLSHSENAVTVYTGQNMPTEEFDFACPLLSLPSVFNTSLETIPQSFSYIQANSECSIRWRKNLNEIDNSNIYRVGVVWAGNPKHINDRKRSIPFNVFSKLFEISNINWISLQVGVGAEDVKESSCKVNAVSETIIDFYETAGIIDNLDLVITVDTSVAHLAGAMGKKTWVLLPFAPDWRWQLECEDSPWYPTIRLFRQSRIGNWQDVLEKVEEAIKVELHFKSTIQRTELC